MGCMIHTMVPVYTARSTQFTRYQVAMYSAKNRIIIVSRGVCFLDTAVPGTRTDGVSVFIRIYPLTPVSWGFVLSWLNERRRLLLEASVIKIAQQLLWFLFYFYFFSIQYLVPGSVCIVLVPQKLCSSALVSFATLIALQFYSSVALQPSQSCSSAALQPCSSAALLSFRPYENS